MSKIKSVLIVLLSGLAIYLTSQLWFANISSRNFFYSFFLQTETGDANNEKSFAWPYRLITNYGKNVFSIQYSGMDISKLRESCDGAISSALKEGVYLDTRGLDYAEVFNGPGYIYEYSFNMPLTVFSSIFGRPGFSDKLEYINSVVFLPPGADGDETHVWMLDEVNMIMSGYAVKSTLLPVSANPEEFYQEILFESSVLSAYDLSEKNIFIARFMENGYKYPTVSIINPYVEGELLMGAIEQKVNVFFENPSAKLSFMGDNVYTYSDAKTVVKYFQNDVLEYSNYQAGGGDSGILKSFGTALGFIKSDSFIQNEYYLADFAQEDDEYVFYFDFVVNNFPLVLPDEYKSSKIQSGALAIKHAIEIKVKEGNVVNYRKIVYNFMKDASGKIAKLDFKMELAEDRAILQSNQDVITDIVLGYKIERDMKTDLYWIMRLGDQSHSKSLSRME